MATNTVRSTLVMRNDLAANWASRNPILAQGELGIEIDTNLLKVGNGSDYYNDLPYLNKFANVDGKLVTLDDNGNITLGSFGDEYYVWNDATQEYDAVTVDSSHPLPAELEAKVVDGELIWVESTTGGTVDPALLAGKLDKSGGTMTGALTLAGNPTLPLHAATKQYVDATVANAGHLKREIVTTLPAVADADEHTIYMVLDETIPGADKYREYMLIGMALTQIGDTTVDLSNYVPKVNGATAGNIVTLAADGTLVDSGIAATSLGQIATTSTLGLVRSSTAITPNAVQVNSSTGQMTLTTVSTSLLYVPTGDSFVIDGGGA